MLQETPDLWVNDVDCSIVLQARVPPRPLCTDSLKAILVRVMTFLGEALGATGQPCQIRTS